MYQDDNRYYYHEQRTIERWTGHHNMIFIHSKVCAVLMSKFNRSRRRYKLRINRRYCFKPREWRIIRRRVWTLHTVFTNFNEYRESLVHTHTFDGYSRVSEPKNYIVRYERRYKTNNGLSKVRRKTIKTYIL